MGADALKWWVKGYDAIIVAHGEAESGKSYAIFGSDDGEHGLAPYLLYALFETSEAADDDEPLQLGVACFEMRHNGIHDMLGRQPAKPTSDPERPITVACQSAQEADARSRAARRAEPR
jgi:hypothetical protein